MTQKKPLSLTIKAGGKAKLKSVANQTAPAAMSKAVPEREPAIEQKAKPRIERRVVDDEGHAVRVASERAAERGKTPVIGQIKPMKVMARPANAAPSVAPVAAAPKGERLKARAELAATYAGILGVPCVARDLLEGMEQVEPVHLEVQPLGVAGVLRVIAGQATEGGLVAAELLQEDAGE